MHMKSSVFFVVLNMSFRASIIILAVICIRQFLKKMPKLFSYALWGVVLLRLLCPVSFELPVSILPENIDNGSALSKVTDSYVGQHNVYWNTTEEYQTAISYGIEPVIVPQNNDGNMGAYVVTATDGISQANTIYNTWLPVLSNIWLAGMTVLIGYHLISFFKLKKKLKESVPYNEEEDIYFSDKIDTPFVIGYFFPCIYLPSNLKEKELTYILLHERYHIQRKDYILKVLAFVTLCVHWFNPFVWLAFILACKDMEMSCDEAVLKKLGAEIKADYSSSLLNLAVKKRLFSEMTIAFGESSVKERIQNALHWKKPTFKTMFAATVICIATILLCIGNPKNHTITHPYQWTHNLSIDDIDSCSTSKWGKDLVYYYTYEKNKADLVYVLNQLSMADFEKGNAISKGEITVTLICNGRQYMLTYGNGTTMFSFEENGNSKAGIWQTKDKQLSNCIKQIISDSFQISKTIPQNPLTPMKDYVLKMRNMVLKGMDEAEIKRLKELVQIENQQYEYAYIKGEQFSGYTNLDWDRYAEDTEDSTSLSKNFYDLLDTMHGLLKTDLLDADIEELRKDMELAVETHDVNYLLKIYYKLHDLDYFLLRYGPDDVGPYVWDDSCVRTYYGSLKVYDGFLPVIVEAYNQTAHSYYKMSDGTWRTASNCYKYRLEFVEKLPNTDKARHFVVLSNRKDITFKETLEAIEASSPFGNGFPVVDALIVFDWQE